TGEQERTGDILNNLGDVYVHQSKGPMSMELFTRALALYEQLGIQDKVALELEKLAQEGYSLGQYELAIRQAARALDIYASIPTPSPVTGLTGVVAIAGGYSHSLALTSDGTVWAWGRNYSGELGNGTFTPDPPGGIATPAPVIGLTGVVAVASGFGHSLALV